MNAHIVEMVYVCSRSNFDTFKVPSPELKPKGKARNNSEHHVVTPYILGTPGLSSSPVTLTTPPLQVTSAITGWNSSSDVSGMSTTNGINYQVYAFKTTGTTYTLTYSSGAASNVYVLAVGGGGGGSTAGGAGGGAGGVVMMPVVLPSSGGLNYGPGWRGMGRILRMRM